MRAQNLHCGCRRLQTNEYSSVESIGETRMKIKPLGDRIVIKRFEAEGKSTGGILLPESAKNKPQKGTVLAVGPGKRLKDGGLSKMQLKVNDVVLFTNW